MIIGGIVILLFVLYAILVLYFAKTWQSVPEFPVPGKKVPVKISVIIPARNEEKNIGSLLQALQEQSYPASQFEVIVVDDHSTDATAAIAEKFPGVKLVRLSGGTENSFKKKAIESGIAAATGELIVTTDADCRPPSRWLETIAAFRQSGKNLFIAAPVDMRGNGSLLQRFQEIDFMILQAITGAAVWRNILSMCNGANLAYTKEAFQQAGGFSGIDSIASGDDMLLMQKILQKFPGSAGYLKAREAVVVTRPEQTWKKFFSQRIRWASKAGFYSDRRLLPVLVLVYLFNLSFPALLIAGFFCYYYWISVAALWVLKTLAEWPLCASAADFFGKKNIFFRFFLFQPLHIIYTLVSGFFGQFGRYEWKGRRVR